MLQLLKGVVAFFFFFFFEKNEFDIIKRCLNQYLEKCISINYYCDLSKLFADNVTKKEIQNNTKFYSSEIQSLYKKKYPKNIQDLKIISILFNYKINSITDDEAFAILFWSFKIFKNQRPFNKNKTEILRELWDLFEDDFLERAYNYYDSIVYDTNNVSCNIVRSISDYLGLLTNYSSKKTLYFRGHPKTSYELKPSVLRSENLMKNEMNAYQELLIECPEDFKAYKRHIDFLVKMQHYGLPTRLLDITRNPLVALYFSCCNDHDDRGEIIVFSPNKQQIKYENSDTVAMISSLPLFSYEEHIAIMDNLYVRQKDELNIIERFIHEIQNEKPGFVNRIKPGDLEKCYVVLPKKDNNRIIKQDGAFIICGINQHPEKMINKTLRLNHENKSILLFVENKREILKELDLLSINRSTLFPELDNVAEYIKLKYLEFE